MRARAPQSGGSAEGIAHADSRAVACAGAGVAVRAVRMQDTQGRLRLMRVPMVMAVARARRELELAVRDSLQQEPDAVRNESAAVEEKLTQMTSKVLPGGIAYVSP